VKRLSSYEKPLALSGPFQTELCDLQSRNIKAPSGC